MRWLRDRARPKLRRDSSIPTNTTHSFAYDDGEYHAEFETTPFSAGASRDAYRGKLVAHAKLGKHNGACVVIKVFKAEYAARSECWAPDLRSHTIAASLARRFNREVPSSHPLYFVMPIVVRIDRAHTASYFARRRHHTGTRGALFGRAARLVGGGEFALLEPFLEGEYKKVISNNGWIADDAGRLPRAFAHWTYHVNYGRRMIVDLQGVRAEDGYKLTDPAMHSLSCEHGATDLGAEGMALFFATHTCNEFCSEQWRRCEAVPRSRLGRRSTPRASFMGGERARTAARTPSASTYRWDVDDLADANRAHAASAGRSLRMRTAFERAYACVENAVYAHIIYGGVEEAQTACVLIALALWCLSPAGLVRMAIRAAITLSVVMYAWWAFSAYLHRGMHR